VPNFVFEADRAGWLMRRRPITVPELAHSANAALHF